MNDIPYRPQVKLSRSYPFAEGFQVSATLQVLPCRPIGTLTTTGNKISGPGYGDVGSPVGTNWLLTRTTRYPTNCP